MFKRILAAVDDSNRMRLVMQAGRTLAEHGDGALVVLRVRADEAERDYVTDSDAALAEQTSALRMEGKPAHYLLHAGDPEKRIILTARQQKSTLIIIASRLAGPRALPQRRMTARLAAHAPAPVLVIPELAENGATENGGAEPASPLFGADDAPLLVALDGSPLAEQALPYAAELATLLGRPLVLVYVALPVLSQEELAQAWAYIEGARRRLRERISRDLSVDIQVFTGTPIDELLWAAEGRRAGAIILCARGKTGVSARRASHTALEALRRTPIPALVIPAPMLTEPPAEWTGAYPQESAQSAGPELSQN